MANFEINFITKFPNLLCHVPGFCLEEKYSASATEIPYFSFDNTLIKHPLKGCENPRMFIQSQIRLWQRFRFVAKIFQTIYNFGKQYYWESVGKERNIKSISSVRSRKGP